MGGGSLKTFIKVVKLNERLLHINEHYNMYTLNAFITSQVRLVFASILHWAISVPASLGKDALSRGERVFALKQW